MAMQTQENDALVEAYRNQAAIDRKAAERKWGKYQEHRADESNRGMKEAKRRMVLAAKLYAEGVPQKQIAKQMGLNQSTVCAVLKRAAKKFPMDKRKLAILLMCEDGVKLRTIGEKFGISHQAVGQLKKRYLDT